MSNYRKRIPDALRCRCCLQPVHIFWQKNLVVQGGKYYVHCTSRGCPLYFATREINDWLTMDLAQWEAVQHPHWVESPPNPPRQPA
jgi:hypothetical protein